MNWVNIINHDQALMMANQNITMCDPYSSMSGLTHLDNIDTMQHGTDVNLLPIVSEYDGEDLMNQAFLLEHSEAAFRKKEKNSDEALSDVKDQLSALDVKAFSISTC